nr:DIP1984 family protein [Micromonospora matsumotoense]
MKLAEALALRADAARRAEQLRARIVASARFQEGETPAEDAAALLAEVGGVLGELETLIRRINRTNAATVVDGGTLTDALARRDVLRLRHGVVTSAADAAAGGGPAGVSAVAVGAEDDPGAAGGATARPGRRSRPAAPRGRHPDPADQLGGRPAGLTGCGAGSRRGGGHEPESRRVFRLTPGAPRAGAGVRSPGTHRTPRTAHR